MEVLCCAQIHVLLMPPKSNLYASLGMGGGIYVQLHVQQTLSRGKIIAGQVMEEAHCVQLHVKPMPLKTKVCANQGMEGHCFVLQHV